MFKEQTLRGQRRNGLSKNTLLDNRFLRTTPSPLLWRALIKHQETGEHQKKTKRFKKDLVRTLRTLRGGFKSEKILLVSVKFVSVILGPEMGAPILWTPGKNVVLSAGKTMSIKFLVLGGGGGILGFGGGGSADFIFFGDSRAQDRKRSLHNGGQVGTPNV